MDLDDAIVENLMPDLVGHDRHPAAFLVFLYLWSQTRRVPRRRIPLREIADGTGLSKRSVQSAIQRLRKRRLLSVTRESVTAVPLYTLHWPWVKEEGSRSSRNGPASQ